MYYTIHHTTSGVTLRVGFGIISVPVVDIRMQQTRNRIKADLQPSHEATRSSRVFLRSWQLDS